MDKVFFFAFRCLTYFFKVKRNRILFISWGGEKWSCNPRAFAEFLVTQESGYEMIVVSQNSESVSSVFKRVRPKTLLYFYYAHTSKVIVNNSRIRHYLFFWKKKNQLYIQTFHGTPIKKIEKDVADVLSPSYLKIAHIDSGMTDLMVSGNSIQSRIFRDSFWYTNQILEIGNPRNDVFFSNKKKHYLTQIQKQYKLKSEENYVLYCPTFRNNGRLDVFEINVDQLLQGLREKWPGNWKLLVKFHPNMVKMDGFENAFDLNHKDVVHCSDYPEIQDLLVIADLLITDCSSSILDFSILQKPAFTYMVDFQEYDRGFYYSLDSMPFPFAASQSQLLENIRNFNSEKYSNELKSFHEGTLGLFDRGVAAQNLEKWIREKLND